MVHLKALTKQCARPVTVLLRRRRQIGWGGKKRRNGETKLNTRTRRGETGRATDGKLYSPLMALAGNVGNQIACAFAGSVFRLNKGSRVCSPRATYHVLAWHRVTRDINVYRCARGFALFRNIASRSSQGTHNLTTSRPRSYIPCSRAHFYTRHRP